MRSSPKCPPTILKTQLSETFFFFFFLFSLLASTKWTKQVKYLKQLSWLRLRSIHKQDVSGMYGVRIQILPQNSWVFSLKKHVRLGFSAQMEAGLPPDEEWESAARVEGNKGRDSWRTSFLTIANHQRMWVLFFYPEQQNKATFRLHPPQL